MTRIITMPRRSGKTTMAIRIANEKDAILVVHSAEERDRLMELPKEQRPINRPALFSALLLNGLEGTRKPLIIDNAEYLIKRVCSQKNVVAIFMTDSEYDVDYGI